MERALGRKQVSFPCFIEIAMTELPAMAFILCFCFQRRLDEALKQRMGFVGAALEFRVILDTDEKVITGNNHGFHQTPVR